MSPKLHTPLHTMISVAGVLGMKSLEQLPLRRKHILVISTAVINTCLTATWNYATTFYDVPHY